MELVLSSIILQGIWKYEATDTLLVIKWSRIFANMLNEVKWTLGEGVVENTCPIKGDCYKMLIGVLQELGLYVPWGFSESLS